MPCVAHSSTRTILPKQADRIGLVLQVRRHYVDLIRSSYPPPDSHNHVFCRPEAPAVAPQPTSFQKVAMPKMLRMADVQLPQEYAFHPGRTWVHDEGHQYARIGIDAFASGLFGQIDGSEVAELNGWVRQGQKLCTLKHGDNGC